MVVTGEGMTGFRSKMMDDYSSTQQPGEFPSWSNPPMLMGSPDLVRLPFPHFALIYIDRAGQLRFDASESIRRCHRHFFTPDLQQRFLEAAGIKSSSRNSMLADSSSQGGHHPARSEFGYSSSHHLGPKKRRRGSRQLRGMEMANADLNSDCCQEDDDLMLESVDQIPLEIGDEEKVQAYYERAFRAFQQINCRQVAKAYIKIIEPRKQVKHPYNGGKGAPGEKGDPEKTKPDWWPDGVIHREPDHLKKPDRIRLLIHIFRKLGESRGITAAKLEDAGKDAQRQIKPPEKLEILNEIYRVRRTEESYERGEIDANTVIFVANRDSSARNDRDSESLSESGRVPAPRDSEDHEIVQAVAAEVPIRPPRSTSKYLIPPSKERDVSATDEKSHIFQMSSLGAFETRSQNSNSFSPAAMNKVDYPVDFDDRTTERPNDVKPTEPPSIGYMTQDYVTSSVDGSLNLRDAQSQTSLPTQQPAGNFSSWTHFAPAMFNPADYADGSNQGVPQQLLPPQVSLLSTATQSHGLNAHQTHSVLPLPDLHGARAHPQFEDLSLGGPAFRTGSLSHPHVLQHRDNGIGGPMHQFK